MAISSVLTERILDGIALLFILFMSLLFSSHLLAIPWLKALSISATFLFGGLILFIVILKWQKFTLFNLLGKYGGRHTVKLIEIIENISQALEFLRWDRRSAAIFSYSLLIWLIEGSMFVIALVLLDIPANPFIAGYLCLSIVNFGLLVPSSPGFIGVFQAMTILALSLFSISHDSSLAVGIIVHAMQFIPVTIWGVFILAVNSIQLLGKRSE